MRKLFEFYKVRKIVSIGIFIGTLVSVLFLFEQREVFLQFVEDEKIFKTPEDGDWTRVRLSGDAQLSLYNNMFIAELLLLSAISITSLSIVIGLFTEKWNGNRQFKYIIMLSLLLFVVLVVHISLKPIESSKQVGSDALGVPIFEILDGPIYSEAYWVLYISMLTFGFAIYAKKKFGYLRNDVTIIASEHNTIKGVKNV